jgi:hypothetical protein
MCQCLPSTLAFSLRLVVHLKVKHHLRLQGAKYYREWRKAVRAARKHAATSNANRFESTINSQNFGGPALIVSLTNSGSKFRLRKWSQKKDLKYIALRESTPQAMGALDYSTERMEVLDGAGMCFEGLE